MRKTGLILIALLLMGVLVRAEDFEHRITDVRAKAMAGAVTATSFGVGSVSTNPAGLATQKSWEAFVTYSDLFGLDFKQQDFSLALPFLGGGLGVAYTTVGNTEDVLYKITSSQLSYARSNKANTLAWGFSMRRGALDSTGGAAYALALDAGVMGKKGKLAWGLSAHNFFVKTDPVSKAESVPREVKIGVSYDFGKFLLSGELNGTELCFGVEQELFSGVQLRAGYNGYSPTFGLGLKQGSWIVDYAFELGELGNTQSIGLSRQF